MGPSDGNISFKKSVESSHIVMKSFIFTNDKNLNLTNKNKEVVEVALIQYFSLETNK